MAKAGRIGSRSLYAAIAVSLSGCGDPRDASHDDISQRAAVTVDSEILVDYVGVYRMPSGALFHVTQTDGKLYGGTPSAELYAQTTRQFTSDRFFGEIFFDRDAEGNVHRIDYRQAKQSRWCERVDPLQASDPTQMVDVGGHRLRILSIGQGSPAIILEDGFGSGIEVQSSLQAALSRVSQVVAYDHAGTGGSEPGPEPRDARQVAKELRTALSAADIEPPFILVGGSIGGDYCRVFLQQHPDDVAAIVLLDPTPDWEQLIEWAQAHSPERVEAYRRLIRESGEVMEALMQRQESGRLAEWRQLDATRSQAHGSLPPSSVAVIQVTGSAGQLLSSAADDKVRFFDFWLRKHIPHAQHILATDSSHAVGITDEALVLDKVRELVERLQR